VVGDVAKPSEVLINGGLTVTRAIEEAGGLVPGKKSKDVRVFSHLADSPIGMRVIYLDLEAIKKHPYKDLELQSFDIVEVYSPKRVRTKPRPATSPCPSIIPDSFLRGGHM
jgi:protein involved in polysaccharide export with SLBB domain